MPPRRTPLQAPQANAASLTPRPWQGGPPTDIVGAMSAPSHAQNSPPPQALVWMGLAFAAALMAAAAVLARSGADKSGIEAALRLTARLGFALFWPAYVGAALATLFGTVFEPIRRRGRVLGLAFAAVLAVHLTLVAWLCAIGAAPPPRIFVIFGVGVFWTGLLALFSIQRLSPLPGAPGWWVLRHVGMTCILADFAFDFLRRNDGKETLAHTLNYAPFAALVILAPLLRLLAWLKPRVLGAASTQGRARRLKPQAAENASKAG